MKKEKDLQLIAAETICQSISNDLYNWAKRHKIDLVSNGHILSRPENFRMLLSDVLDDETISTLNLLNKQ